MSETQSPLAVYQSYLDKGQLGYQWSPKAGRAVFYPRVVCPYSGSTELEWRGASGLGTGDATTLTHPLQGGGYKIPPLHFDEGFRMMGRVEEHHPMAVKNRMRVKISTHP